MSEIWTRMMSGEPYDAGHPELLDKLQTTRKLIYEFNNLSPERNDERMAIIRRLLGGCGRNIHINSPFRCDYGCNIVVGENFFANFNLTILDEKLRNYRRQRLYRPQCEHLYCVSSSRRHHAQQTG